MPFETRAVKLMGDETHSKGIPPMSLLDLFCHVDDVWQVFAPHWRQHQLQSGLRRRQRTRHLCESEMMTILIYFHQQRYRDFKTYYTQYVQAHLRAEFPGLVSYTRFVELYDVPQKPDSKIAKRSVGQKRYEKHL